MFSSNSPSLCVCVGGCRRTHYIERVVKPQTSRKDKAVLGPHEESHARPTKQERLSEAMSGAFIRDEDIQASVSVKGT